MTKLEQTKIIAKGLNTVSNGLTEKADYFKEFDMEEQELEMRRMIFIVEQAKEFVLNCCFHPKTVALNEEGHAGVFCPDCGKQLEKEC